MPKTRDWSQFNLGTPAFYHITVRGFLENSWSEQLGGLHIHHETSDENARFTILEGELVDQAALFGVLNSLYGLGFPILSVEATP